MIKFANLSSFFCDGFLLVATCLLRCALIPVRLMASPNIFALLDLGISLLFIITFSGFSLEMDRS